MGVGSRSRSGSAPAGGSRSPGPQARQQAGRLTGHIARTKSGTSARLLDGGMWHVDERQCRGTQPCVGGRRCTPARGQARPPSLSPLPAAHAAAALHAAAAAMGYVIPWPRIRSLAWLARPLSPRLRPRMFVLPQEFKGYVFKIMGGQDKQGFPMKQGVLTNGRVQVGAGGAAHHGAGRAPMGTRGAASSARPAAARHAACSAAGAASSGCTAGPGGPQGRAGRQSRSQAQQEPRLQQQSSGSNSSAAQRLGSWQQFNKEQYHTGGGSPGARASCWHVRGSPRAPLLRLARMQLRGCSQA